MAVRPQGYGRGDALTDLANLFENAIERPTANRAKPLPEQELFFQDTRPNRIILGGNQSGKTWSGCLDDVLVLIKKHPHRQHLYGTGPIYMRVIGVDFERGIDQGILPYFQQFIPPSALVDGSWERSYRKADHVLTLADRSTVSFMSYEQDPNKFQAVRLHHIHYDEEPPQPIFEEGLPRLLRYNGTWSITETPVQQLEWLQDELIEPAEDGERTDIGVHRLDTRNNIHLSTEKVADLASGLSAEQALVRLQGQYLSGSLVFPEFEKRYPYVIPDTFTPVGTDWAIYASMDFGYSNPTAWLWTAAHRDGSVVTFDMLYGANIIVSEWSKLVLQKNREIAARLGLDPERWAPYAYFGDPAISQRGNGITGLTVQQEYARHGISIGTEGIVAQRVGNQNIGLDRMHSMLARRPLDRRSASTGETGEPWWQITENCSPLIVEMKKARKPKQSVKQAELQNQKEAIRDKDNHAIDAAKYLFLSTRILAPAPDQPFRETPGLPEMFRGATPYAPQRAGEIVSATIGANPWTVQPRGDHDYQTLEG